MLSSAGSFIIDLSKVKQENSTYFIEIQQGFYSVRSNIWDKNSIYVHGDIWLDIFNALACEFFPDYDFFDFSNIRKEHHQKFAAKLLQLIPIIEKVRNLNDFSQPELLSASKVPYIQIGNGIWDFIHEGQEATQETFVQNFSQNIRKIIQSYQDLADWLIKNKQNSICILGI